MPYIGQKKRDEIAPHIKDLLTYIMNTPKLETGDLNYIITLVIKEFYKRKKCYDHASKVTAATTDARDEFKRRVLNSYEDQKIIQNGDLYNDL
jgi:hypothetical protein